jgi:hypothetical protein
METGPLRQARSLKQSLVSLTTMFQRIRQQPTKHKKVVNLVTRKRKTGLFKSPEFCPLKGLRFRRFYSKTKYSKNTKES